jgi:hypothetical protein
MLAGGHHHTLHDTVQYVVIVNSVRSSLIHALSVADSKAQFQLPPRRKVYPLSLPSASTLSSELKGGGRLGRDRAAKRHVG